MLFTADAWPGIADGSITVTFRGWKRAQAKQGGRYRVAGMLIEATDVRQVRRDDITDDDARRAGATDRGTLLTRLGDAEPVWRIDFVLVGQDDRIERRESTDHECIAGVLSTLQRLDRTAPWTAATLELIERCPAIVSTTLAGEMGMDRVVFKQKVRKLKELGLTESLEIGYRLSARGRAVLRELNRQRAGDAPARTVQP
jgi:hypothetical protein